MTIMRRVINERKCHKTFRFLKIPPNKSRTGIIGDNFPRNMRHGPNSLLVEGLKLLNDARWYRDKGKDTDDAFKKFAKNFILSQFNKGNFK